MCMMPESDGAVLHAMRQVAGSLEYVERLKRSLQEENLTAEEVERALQPALSFHAQLQEDLERLERSNSD